MVKWQPAARARQTGRVWPFMLVVLLAAGGFAWWYFAPDSLPDPVRKLLPASARANPVLYRWRDDKGRWTVTDAPPADRKYDVIRYDPRTNVVPSVVPPPPAETH